MSSGFADLSSGWVRLWRDSQNSEQFVDDATWKMWTFILMRASHVDRVIKVVLPRGRTTQRLKVGQLIFGRKKWAEYLGWDESSVRRNLERLVKMGCVSVEACGQYSIISVQNWEKFNPTNDGDEEEDLTSREDVVTPCIDDSCDFPPEETSQSSPPVGQPLASCGPVVAVCQPGVGQLLTTNKNSKNSKKNINKSVGEKDPYPDDFRRWYSHFPKKASKAKAAQAFEKAVRAIAADSDHPELDTRSKVVEFLVDRADAYAAEKAGSQFVQYPATWLNAAAYDDELEVDRASKGLSGGGAKATKEELAAHGYTLVEFDDDEL